MRKCLVFLFLCLPVTAGAANMSTLKDMKAYFNQSVRNATVPDSELVVFINDGIQAVGDELRGYHRKDTIVTTSGNSDYSLNSDILLNGVTSVELKNSGMRYGLDWVPPHKIGKVAERSGCPQTYYVRGEILTIYPEGTAQACTMIVSYDAEPNYLSEDSMSTAALPLPHRFIAVMYAVYRYYDSIKHRDNDAVTALTAYQAAIARKQPLLQPRPTITGEP